MKAAALPLFENLNRHIFFGKLSSQGLKDGLPIVIGYFPYGIAYGLLSNQVGLSFFETMGMSLAVYAGGAQLVALGMIASGQAFVSIVIACLAVNLRYLLLASAMVPEIQPWKSWARRFFLYYLSDEVFAVFNGSRRRDQRYGLTLTVTGLLAWFVSSTLGYTVGPLLPDLKSLGLDYALTCVFVGLVAVLANTRELLVVALLAGLTALFLHLLGLGAFAVVGATAAVSMVVSTWESYLSRRRRPFPQFKPEDYRP